LDEKEKENDSIRSQVEKLQTDLEEQKTLTVAEKEELKKSIAEKEEEASKLRGEIKALKGMTATSILTSTTTPPSGWSGYSGYRGAIDKLDASTLVFTTKQMCHKCGEIYNVRAIGENGLCPKCNKEGK